MCASADRLPRRLVDVEEFDELMALPVRTYRDYPNDSKRYERVLALARRARVRVLTPCRSRR